MEKHCKELLHHVPDLLSRYVLDLGAGRGKFLIALVKLGGKGEGLEINPAYIKEAQKNGEDAGVSLKITEGVGEKLPYDDNCFDFANLSEVIEHVQDPILVVRELHRVLRTEGVAYVSIPNRFGFRDPHYHLYGINWLPRWFAEKIIFWLGKIKDEHGEAGHQKLSEMHYMTYRDAKKFFLENGFDAKDIREIKIQERYKTPLLFVFVTCVYRILRFYYFDSFHFLVYKREN